MNVVAHEFCHLAAFMISNMHNHPHGEEFKGWARRVTDTFGRSRGVHVNTRYTIEINYKHAWRCVGCGHLYQTS
jgi:predicted SprT family Zn-dependent metalloprotease